MRFCGLTDNKLTVSAQAITVRCRYNAVNFLQDPHNRHPIACPSGRGMGVFCVSSIWLIQFNYCINSGYPNKGTVMTRDTGDNNTQTDICTVHQQNTDIYKEQYNGSICTFELNQSDSDWYSASVLVIIYVLSVNIGLCHNSTPLYSV